MFVAHIGDSSFNPARSFGPAIVHIIGKDTSARKVLPVLILAPIAGGLLGCGLLYGDEEKEDST